MFIGIFELDNKQNNFIYSDNFEGWREWHKDTFSPNTKHIKILMFKAIGKTYREKQDSIIELAKEWQNNFACYDWSYSELTTIYNFFERYAKRYGLIKEFKENAII